MTIIEIIKGEAKKMLVRSLRFDGWRIAVIGRGDPASCFDGNIDIDAGQDGTFSDDAGNRSFCFASDIAHNRSITTCVYTLMSKPSGTV